MTFEIPSLPTYTALSREQLEALDKSDQPTGRSGKYWEKLYKQFTAVSKDDNAQKAEILAKGIREIGRLFPNDGDIAMRRAYYHLGHTLERMATFDGMPEQENQRLFMSAAQCYIIAETIFGMWTGYSIRAINCLGSAGEIGMAQALSNEIYGENGPMVVGDSTARGKDLIERMRNTKYVQLDEMGNRIYDIYMPDE